jgi:hypothetical protein
MIPWSPYLLKICLRKKRRSCRESVSFHSSSRLPSVVSFTSCPTAPPASNKQQAITNKHECSILQYILTLISIISEYISIVTLQAFNHEQVIPEYILIVTLHTYKFQNTFWLLHYSRIIMNTLFQNIFWLLHYTRINSRIYFDRYTTRV